MAIYYTYNQLNQLDIFQYILRNNYNYLDFRTTMVNYIFGKSNRKHV